MNAEEKVIINYLKGWTTTFVSGKEIARKVECHYGRPQDIEWAIDRAGQIHLLQSRPETVWSKNKAPLPNP